MTQELHITTDECLLMFDDTEIANQFCVTCGCWFSGKNAEVISIYDARHPQHSFAIPDGATA